MIEDENVDDDPPAFRRFLASSVIALSVVLLFPILPLWPALAMVGQFSAGPIDHLVAWTLIGAPALLAAAILIAFASRRTGNRLLMSLAAFLSLGVLTAFTLIMRA